MNSLDICQNLEKIKQKVAETCKSCGRNPDEITLVAVSKTKPNDSILQAVQCGQLHFGENRMKELEDKMTEISNPDLSWHMIGNLQTNKIKFIADRVNWIHSVEKAKYLKEINKRAQKEERVINTLIQVNISDEDQKGGCKPEDLSDILKEAESFNHIRVKGLMGMASFVDDPEQVRPQFRLLKELFDSHQSYRNEIVDLQHLSMGMTNDFEVAIEEGATIIRVGSAIFGARNYS